MFVNCIVKEIDCMMVLTPYEKDAHFEKLQEKFPKISIVNTITLN